MKKLLVSFVLVATGSFAMAQQMGKMEQMAGMQQKREARLLEMKQQLNLSDAQVTEIRALTEKQRINAEEARKAMRKEIHMKEKSEMNIGMKNILTPEQYTSWQSMKARKRHEKITKKPMELQKMSPAH